MRRAAVLLFFLAAIAAVSPSANGERREQKILSRTRIFLDAYARGDRAVVLNMMDEQRVTVYGSDAAEVFHGAAAVESMLANDQRLWGGAARIGEMQHVSAMEHGGLAVVIFDAPFTVGDRPPVLVRFTMAWQRLGGQWKLVGSSNVAPTHGQSAAELLAGGH